VGGSWLKSTGLFFVSGIITILCSSFSDEFQAKRESGYLVADTDKSMIIFAQVQENHRWCKIGPEIQGSFLCFRSAIPSHDLIS
jgi:hypothetical protein